jgi:hypothetical protein
MVPIRPCNQPWWHRGSPVGWSGESAIGRPARARDGNVPATNHDLQSCVSKSDVLVTCSCSGLRPAEEFLALFRAAARKAERPAQILAFGGAAADHPVALDTPESSYLKVAWLRMGEPGG